MSGMNMGMKKGLTRPGPRACSRSCWASMVEMPPIPLPKITPNRSEATPLGAPSNPALRMASAAAPTLNRTNRS